MTKFTDGPAQGITLMLRRVPILLRVTRNSKSEFDALNEPDDTANADETLFVYRRFGDIGTVHINAKRGRGGFFPMAQYKLEPDPPTDGILRDNAKWREWAIARYADPRHLDASRPNAIASSKESQ